MERRYGATLKIYTDGSKDPSQPYTGCAMVVTELGLSYGFKLNQHLTVYATELIAILKALESNITNLTTWSYLQIHKHRLGQE